MKDWILNKWWKKGIYIAGIVLLLIDFILPFIIGFIEGILGI